VKSLILYKLANERELTEGEKAFADKWVSSARAGVEFVPEGLTKLTFRDLTKKD
jgi:hypothetical protein